ncbi:hypothetical protein BJY21_003097 [Kineosphaera limosa]|uniref:Putative aldolase n=1 Tax=Kineosphaera limosa NBRC 100340 TaxID=1184609 RepID=K6XBD6_9MICO|nr:bifunctional 4-hydroxy-2-oxoglutarate aldolase/2-dehydro-3-deoxy-phosphogluconate aldolase [Kineosphaera limosa]NYE01913.1 hypothetical protein [Kineosphaera limosa]GAB96139.1 putative aldolase [Kineosphaera limosa NBRC 100340]
MTDVDFFGARLAELPVIAIFRGLSPKEAVAQACEAWDHGVALVEVTLQDDSGYAALEAVANAASDPLSVGAGTITTPEQLRRAMDHGARFGIAPGLDADTVAAALDPDDGIPFLPGVATASEVQAAQRLGGGGNQGVPRVPADPRVDHRHVRPLPPDELHCHWRDHPRERWRLPLRWGFRSRRGRQARGRTPSESLRRRPISTRQHHMLGSGFDARA